MSALDGERGALGRYVRLQIFFCDVWIFPQKWYNTVHHYALYTLSGSQKKQDCASAVSAAVPVVYFKSWFLLGVLHVCLKITAKNNRVLFVNPYNNITNNLKLFRLFVMLVVYI